MSTIFKTIFLLMFIGTGFAQNDFDIRPSYIKKNALEYLSEEKSFAGQSLQPHPEYDVLRYNINIKILPDSQKIIAETSIQFVVKTEMSGNLYFDFIGLQLDSTFLDSNWISGRLSGNLLAIELETPLMADDSHMVKIYYQGTPEKGLYFRNNSSGDKVVYSHNEPYDARYWFPCKDDPSDKALLTMAISVPDPFIVLSNGQLIEKRIIGPAASQYIWQENYPIATYLISIAASPYLITTNNFSWNRSELLLEYYVYPEDLSRGADALEMVKDMLDFYSPYIGEYPFFFEKYSMSEVPFKEAAAMENQTATTMGDFVMDDEEVIAHELAHQWWGDALTPQSFVDIWLNEGFATYFDALFTEHKYGEEAFLQRMSSFRDYIFSDGSFEYPIYNPPPQYLFGSAVYMKGAWVLHMLRYEIGDAVFNEIIRQYYQRYNYLNVTTANFIETVESVSGMSYISFFNQWLNYGGMPLLLGSWEQDNNLLHVMIRQEQEEPVYQFDLEVIIEGPSTDSLLVIPISDRESQFSVSFPEPISKLIIDPHEKILNTNNSPVYHIPTHSGLVWLYPNPFNEKITITYQVGFPEEVEIKVFDIQGRVVENLLKERKTTGIYTIEWDGRQYASGMYYCAFTASGLRDVRKMTLVK